MNSITIAGIILGCFFGSAILGMAIRRLLPEHHLSSESKDSVKLGIGLVGTMGALVLGLLVGSAKSSYDTQKSEVTQMAAKVSLLDRVLGHYGEGAEKARALLREWVEQSISQFWPEDRSLTQREPKRTTGEALYDEIQRLEPADDAHKLLRSQALSIAIDVGQTRWLLFHQAESSISPILLALLVTWFAVNFFSFGLFAPRNTTVFMTLLLCAVSVAGAILLILELDQPFDGLIQISSEPMRKALAGLGQ